MFQIGFGMPIHELIRYVTVSKRLSCKCFGCLLNSKRSGKLYINSFLYWNEVHLNFFWTFFDFLKIGRILNQMNFWREKCANLILEHSNFDLQKLKCHTVFLFQVKFISKLCQCTSIPGNHLFYLRAVEWADLQSNVAIMPGSQRISISVFGKRESIELEEKVTYHKTLSSPPLLVRHRKKNVLD